MKDMCLYLQSMAKIALVFVMALICAKPSAAQQDLQIMVSGPWSYVIDNVNAANRGRLLLIAPSKDLHGHPSHHQVYLLPGVDATAFTTATTPTLTGIYKLDYDQTLKGTLPAQELEPAVLCGAKISNLVIGTVSASRGNYVISLPMPKSFSTYVDSSGTYFGYSESRVSTKTFNASVAPVNYTTWMVLHFGVKSIPSRITVNGTASAPISTNGKGISIVMGDPNPTDDDLTCDHVSLESVEERAGLWHSAQFARFPEEEDSTGKQKHYQYDYSDCSDHDPTVHPLGAAGSADCHACQMSISGAVPGATIRP
jgi:hypothetical protein